MTTTRILNRNDLDLLLEEPSPADRLALADVLERENDRDLELRRVREMELDELDALDRLDAALAANDDL